MPLEIERKFLLKNDNWTSAVTKQIDLRQGYLSIDPNKTVRIRTSDNKAWITIKGKSVGASRAEYEYDIPLEDAKDMLALCGTNIITKTRNIVIHNGHTWEIDVFHGNNKGLVLAEIELSDESERFNLPAWIGKEVTGDIRYYNSNLIGGSKNIGK